jgi:hypothetical protein
MIMDRLSRKHAKADRKLALISMGDFYREFTEEQKRMAEKGEFNFDHPGELAKFSFSDYPVFP